MSTPCKAFTDVLRACREEINAQFALMRREFPSLETEPYFAFLRESGDAVVAAVDAVNPSATVETGRAVCEVALELVARNLAGPKARDQWMSAVWQSVLVKAAYLIAMDPRHVIGALSNAAHLLSSTNGTRPAQWITLMQNVASLAADASEFLRAGQVAAWRSGMAHFREGALSIAAGLPSPLALASLDAASETESLLARLKGDPWFAPRAARGDAGLVAQAGAFRGFGGLFLVPPVVTLLNGQWVASSGEDHWLITADAFGATFHRMAGQTIPRPQKPARIPVSVPPEFGEVTSVAENGTTTAVTATLTHAVLFFHTNG